MINLVGVITADLILAQVKERPDFGEEHMVDTMILRPGGLANTIFPLAKLGVKQRVISLLGQDDYGSKIYDEIAPLIENELARTEKGTVLSVSIVKEGGDRYFVTYKGNAYDLTAASVEGEQDFDLARATLLYGYFLAPGFGPDAALACLKRAKAAGQITFFDANSAIDGWSLKSRQEIISFLPYIDYFMPNDEEILHLTGANEVDQAAKHLISLGANTIIVKRGSRGASAYTRSGDVHHAGFPVKAYDTTGAGDSFNAGFIYSVLEEKPLEEALRYGNMLASIVVSKKEDRYPTPDEIERNIMEKAGR
ncbi:carbohydrate kinase family protein [Paenibacillus macerans]|uniref:carbohydrate kinase family protein n=1 Tax=Paenibacillus macerans TaxID=44252 RepID=UPI0022E82117|nr:carbohydrate kinase family protein [Paenibacillus macerans]